MAAANNGATSSTSISLCEREPRSIELSTVLVTTTDSNCESASFCRARPANKPWVASPMTRIAPFLTQASAATNQCGASGNHVVEKYNGLSFHLADHSSTTDDARTTVLFNERAARRHAGHGLDAAAKRVHPLDAAFIGRSNHQVVKCRPLESRDNVAPKQGSRFHLLGDRRAKCVLIGCQVVDVHRHHTLGADRFQHAGHVTARDWITRFRLLVLAGVAQVRNNGRQPTC